MIADDRPWHRPDVKQIRKLLVALAAACGVAAASLADGTFDVGDAIQTAVAFLGALGVYHATNDPPPDEPTGHRHPGG